MSSFGRVFRVTTFGESHCKGVGAIIEGVPPRMPLTEADIQPQLDRRRPGQSELTTGRNEGDRVQILAGTEMGYALGSPLSLLIPNQDQRPGDYAEMKDVPRPSHADFTYQAKYGVRSSSGGGRASARETAARVAAGAVAEQALRHRYPGLSIVAWVSGVGSVKAPKSLEERAARGELTREDVDSNNVKCPDAEAAAQMSELIVKVKSEADSVGGVITCVCRGVPAGWGEPCFDKLEAMLAHAMLSIPATKGFEVGSGFEGTEMRGSDHNDMFVGPASSSASSSSSESARFADLATETNRSGGIQGGISNSQPIVFRVAFKPPATIGRAQKTATFTGEETVLEAKGRHDPCVVPRAVPIVEAMAALVLIDAALIQESRVASALSFAELGVVRRS